MRAGETAYVHYSGHGNLVPDDSGDEVTGQDCCIYPVPFKNKTTFEVIRDDTLREELVNAVPAGCTVSAVFDCCNSGTCLDLRYTAVPAGSTGGITVTENKRYPKTKGQVFLLSACTDKQKAAETTTRGMPCGVLTKALLESLPTPGATKITRILGIIRAKVRAMGYSQITQLSCGAAAAFDAALL
jgi:hypothetical protein